MNAASERTIRARNKQILKDRETNTTVITTLMHTIDGRRWIWLKLESAGCFRSDEGLDPYRMAFEKGVRNEGLRLLADVTRITPSLYITMTTENSGVAFKDETNDGRDGSDAE